MEVKIYADMVFLVNLSMNYFIFWITSKLVRKKVKPHRLFFGSFASSLLFCLIIFIDGLRKFYNFPAAVFILMAGIVIAFAPKKIKEFLNLLGLAHISAFGVGGLGVALFYYTNLTNYIGNFLSVGIRNFSVNILIISTSISFVVIKLTLAWIKRVFIKKQTFYTIKIHMENEDLSLLALIDTGNLLSDPVSKMPVIVTEFNAVKAFLPDGMKLLFYENKENNLDEMVNYIGEKPFTNRIRMIPFSSIGKQNGMLIGFKPDLVEIYKEEATISVREVVIGIYNYSLSKDGAYQGLINPEILV